MNYNSEIPSPISGYAEIIQPGNIVPIYGHAEIIQRGDIVPM